MKLPRYLFMILLASLSPACTTSDLTPVLATDDCGPKPQHYKEIAAEWFNVHYRYVPPNPIRPEELSVSPPVQVASVDVMLGRKVGWQVILGPENKMVRDFTDSNYTRLIINHDRIVSVTSSDRPFEPPNPPPVASNR